MLNIPKRAKRHSGFKIVSPLNITSYLVVLALSSSSRLVQFKGLFDQAPLPLPLSLRVVRGECGAVVLISTAKKEMSWPSINATINHSSSEWQNVANLTGTTTDHTYFL